MQPKYQINNDVFIIENYNHAKAFASFFPGIAGIWGKPLWLYYVNRGQAVACFGVKDKDGAMLEFQPANKAYRYTPLQGFRTFLKIDQTFYEPFKPSLDPDVRQTMHVAAHNLRLSDYNKKYGIETEVLYYTLPNASFPALIRVLTIKNISKRQKKIEWIDGMPVINPFGTNDFLLKNMSRIGESLYNGVLFSDKLRVPIYKLLIQPHDKPQIIPIEEAHFYAGFSCQGQKLQFPKWIVDHENVFGPTSSLLFPQAFITKNPFTIDSKLISKNKTPSAMGYGKLSLKPNEVFTYYSVVGHANRDVDVDGCVKTLMERNVLENKAQENETIIHGISDTLFTKSAFKTFDNYCRQAYLDNILRGGYPVLLGNGEQAKQFYVYSRIHGDMEREYNNFVLLPEYFSQGNGSYRDINQNRRNDTLLFPKIKETNILTFVNLIQLDAFNPLKVMGSKWKVSDPQPILQALPSEGKDVVSAFLQTPFSLGSLFTLMEKKQITPLVSKEDFIRILMESCEKIDLADPGECYWSDHWHYTLDLIENFLAVYPDEKETLLFHKKIFTFYDNSHVVMPRSEKYVLSHGEPRQYHAVVIDQHKDSLIKSRKEYPHQVRTDYGHGSIYHTTLICKILCVIANKYASLDPDGIGIEMESDKPNWCDALNGLPGVFGSSTAESIELKRFLQFMDESFTHASVAKQEHIMIPEEVLHLLTELEEITKRHANESFTFWDMTHTAKEKYREKIKCGISGRETGISIQRIQEILKLFLEKVDAGIEKAWDSKTGIIHTYFEYLPDQYEKVWENGQEKKNRHGEIHIHVKNFKRNPLPIFLEGPVHYLRVLQDADKAKKIHKSVLASELYDKKIKMLKLNAPLDQADVRIGRIKVFTPGWLENESVFMHMEYKYLLELIRNGLVEEFFQLASTALVPFMDPRVYGRSIFEHSSFIVSSAHPESKIHGQGFVSRLTGTTSEFISIWTALTSGLMPYQLDQQGKLILKFLPQLPGNFFTKQASTVRRYGKNGKSESVEIPKNAFAFVFSGESLVIYHNPSRKNTFGKNRAKIEKIILTDANGKQQTFEGDILPAPYAAEVRSGKIRSLDIFLR